MYLLRKKKFNFLENFFNKEYYYYDEKTYQYNHYFNRSHFVEKENYLPFNSKNITLKKVHHYLFKTNDPRKLNIYNAIMMIIALNLLTFFVTYKYKKYSKKNLQSIVNISISEGSE